MADEWGDLAETWENASVQKYSEEVMRTIREKMSSLDGMKVLDIGAGTGLLSRKLAPLCAHVVALEPSPKMMTVCRKKTIVENISFHEGVIDTSFVNTRVGTFDFIVASSVCAFIPEYLELLSLISQLLKPGGFFLQFDWEFAHSTMDDHAKAFKGSAH